jgi:hypothetical protein
MATVHLDQGPSNATASPTAFSIAIWEEFRERFFVLFSGSFAGIERAAAAYRVTKARIACAPGS